MKKVTFLLSAIFLTAALFGWNLSAVSAQDIASNEREEHINVAYREVFGRNPNPKERQYWKNQFGWTHASNVDEGEDASKAFKKLKGWLRDYLVKPEGEPELIGVLNRSYKNSFGREPKKEENAYWKKEIYAKKFGYEDLVKFQREWLKSDQGSADRAYLIMQAYLNGIGRAPNPADSEYWQGKIKSDGTVYKELLNAVITYILGGSQTQAEEFRETVKRAFAAAKMPVPSNDDVVQIRLRIQNKKLDFKQLTEYVASKKWANVKI